MRYRVSAPKHVSATVSIKETGVSVTAMAVVDVSETGCCLCLAEKLPPNQQVDIAFKITPHGFEFASTGKACWARPKQKKGWLIGLSLDNKIPGEQLDELARASILNRRREARRTMNEAVEVKSELGGDFTKALLKDYSGGGFRVEVDSASFELGSRLMMRVPQNPKAVIGKVTSMQPAADPNQIAIGCAFISQDDHAAISELFDPDSKQRWLQKLAHYRPTHWRSVAAIVFLLLTYQLIRVATYQPELVYQLDQAVTGLIQQVREAMTFKG